MKAFSIILAALGGAVVGAAAGMLFAPKKGSETREEIYDFIKEKCPFMKSDKIQELADRIADEIKA